MEPAEIISASKTMEDDGSPAPRKRVRAYGGGTLIKKPGCDNWIACFYVNGRQVQRSTGTTSKMRAEAKLRELLGNVAIGNTTPSSKLKYEDLREALIADYKRKGNRSLVERKAEDGTIIYTVNMGLHHLDSFFGNASVTKISNPTLDRYVAKRQDDGAEPGTINRELAMLRRMFKLATQQRLLPYSQAPSYWPMLKENEPRTGFFEHADFEKLLAKMPVRVKPLLIFLYWVGCRVGAAQKVRWDQISIARREVRLEAAQTKQKEPLTLPLPPELITLLEATPEAEREGPVFYQGAFRRSWRTACEELGLGHSETKPNGRRVFTAIVHDFRRTAARNLIDAGVDPHVVMKITGHKTPSMLQRYNIISTAQLHDAMAKTRAHVLNGRGIEISSSNEQKQLNPAPTAS